MKVPIMFLNGLVVWLVKLLVVILLLGVVVFAASAGEAGSNATDVEELRQKLNNIEGEVAELRQVLQSLRGLVVGLGAVAGVAVVVAVLAWRRAGRGSAGGVEVCG